MATSIQTKSLSIFAAEQFIESVSEPSRSNLYISFGKIESWANDSIPEAANDSVQHKTDIWKNMTHAKRVTGNDIRLVIPRIDWTANTVYNMYDHRANNLFDYPNTKFYVMTTDFNVYKCLDNNGGANSTVMPSYTKPDVTNRTADGYLWKYMYTVNRVERLRFMTDDWIPVKKIDYQNGSGQWDVQQEARNGSVLSIIVTNHGSGYNSSANLSVTIGGDGSGLSANAIRNTTTNSIDYIAVTNPGDNYFLRANAEIRDSSDTPGSGANALVILSPIGGHGSNAHRELGATGIIINIRVKGSENDKIIGANQFRQVALIRDPLERETGNISGNLVISQTISVSLAGLGGAYQLDEWVYQGASLSSFTFKGKVVYFDSSNNSILLANTEGNLTSATLIGDTSSTTRFATDYENTHLIPYSGDVLFIENTLPIARDNDQTEDYKLIITMS